MSENEQDAQKAWDEYSEVAVAGNRRDFMAGRASRDAEVAELHEQLAVEKAYRKDWENEGAVRWIELKDREKANAVAAVEQRLAEAQATIEAIGLERKVIRGAEQDILNGRPEMDALEEIEISNRHIDEILSAPSSTGGNDATNGRMS